LQTVEVPQRAQGDRQKAAFRFNQGAYEKTVRYFSQIFANSFSLVPIGAD
jgi:hypothetical protein